MKILLFLSLSLFLASCSSHIKEEREVEETAAHTKVTDSKTLGGTIHELIRSSKTLSSDQKKELELIVEENKHKANKLTEKSYKYRAVLIQELLSGNINQEKVKILKQDIKKVEIERLKNTFDSVEKISAIVSKHPDNEKFSEHLLNIERAGR